MLKALRKLMPLFIIPFILISGNFAYALAHAECLFTDGGYIVCEKDCCMEIPCRDEESRGKIILKDKSEPCCLMYFEKSTRQDSALPVLKKNQETLKISLPSALKHIIFTQRDSESQPGRILSAANIFLALSILRI